MTYCSMDRNHEATGFYRTAHGTEDYMCEACAERLSPRPTLLYAVMTRLEVKHS